jgi:hypothetical protein
MNKKQLLSAALLFVFSSSLLASVPQLQMQSLRQRAMGGVGVATSVEFPTTSKRRASHYYEAGLKNNPAALAYSKFSFKTPRIGVGVNSDTLEKYEKMQTIMEDTDDDQEQIDAIKDLAPLNIGIKGSLGPGLSLTTKGFGIGVFAEATYFGELYETPLDVIMELEGYTDVVPVIGFGQEFDLMGSPTAVGVSAKFINRSRLYDESTGSDVLTYNLDQLLKVINDQDGQKEVANTELSGVGFDIGFMRKIDSYKYGEGAWGVVFQNIGASLSGEKTITPAGEAERVESVTEEIPMTATVGFSLTTGLFNNLLNVSPWLLGDTVVAADYQFISDNTDFKKNIHMGIEQSLLFDTFRLRGGINQGYVVGGVGFDLALGMFPILHVNYSIYTEEFGENVGNNAIEFQAIEVGILF